MKQLSLKKYIELCFSFEQEPSEENQKQIDNFLSEIQVRTYLPLTEKAITAVEILNVSNIETDAPGFTSLNEINMFFYGLCKYAINLELDLGALMSTYLVYDKCYEHGLADTLLKYCEKDYNRLVQYFDRMINIANINKLIETGSLISNTEFEKWTAEMSSLKDAFTPELIEALKSFEVSQSDLSRDLNHAIAKKIVTDDDKELDKQACKIKKIAHDIVPMNENVPNTAMGDKHDGK